MVIVRALKDVLTLKIKARHDGYCDQFSRLFMTKMLLICSFLMGFDYFSDRISCMIPKDSALSKDFVHSACWIHGFYIFGEMKYRLDESSYYGIPQKVEHDGINQLDQLCNIYDPNFGYTPGCVPMTKLYYLQYQWMPFYVGALAVIYYAPYMVFRIVNTDLVSLKGAIKSVTSDPDSIVRNYFNYKINPVTRLRLRIFLNIAVKILYVLVNVLAFVFTDFLLLGNYIEYGRDYLKYGNRNNTEFHRPIKFRTAPKPGDVLLPSMGFCEINEASLDTRTQFHNKNKFICELSTHVLYQYVLILLWFLFVISIAISILGFVSNILSHLYHMLFFGKWTPKKTIYRFLTLRETEYLIFIKKKNMVLYGDIMRKLKQQRADLQGKFADGFETSNGFV